MKVAFLDTIGLRYNGDTLKHKGLGGSESAIILLSQELVKLGMEVTVINKNDGEDGVRYNGVRYIDIENINNYNGEIYDVLISSRNTCPFAPEHMADECIRSYACNPLHYKDLVDNSNYKVLWLHDTFCSGDEYMQGLLVDGYFDEIFTLSDWHANYIAMAPHDPNKRYHELFKSKMFHTRNGAVAYNKEVELSEKDKDLFVYNSSIPKGMHPLLKEVWPEIRKINPNAKLKVIGGYYDFVDPDPNSFQNQFKNLKKTFDGKDGVEFTGIIKQSEISDIYKEATFMLYPNIYPETFGISVTEAILANTVLIGFNFGALEEISPNSTSYNVEFSYDAFDGQIDRMLDKARQAISDDYLRMQKANMCNAFKPFLGWNVVGLQWKHHFYRKLGLYLDIKETIKHRYNMGNIYKLYGKHFVNPDEYTEDFSYGEKNRIVVVTPVYNAEKYIESCIRSVASQMYDRYEMYILDDMSTDNTNEVARRTIDSLDENIRQKFTVITRSEKKYAVGNQVETISSLYGNPIVVLLDGDDSLVNDPDIFNYINREYELNDVKFTYGSMHSLADNIDLIAQEYPENVKLNKAFRWYLFPWKMPYTHLRTFKKEIFDKVDKDLFKDSDGNYWKAGGDNAMFYPLIEQCKPHEIKAVQRVLVNYNDINPINDYKVNGLEQNKTASKILKSVSKFNRTDFYREIGENNTLHGDHIYYLKQLKKEGIEPKVIFDIGSNVLLWYKEAKALWNDSRIIAFDAIDEFEGLYIENNVEYHLGLLSKEDDKDIRFYQNLDYPAGSSYYRENPDINSRAKELFDETNSVIKNTYTLDTLVKEKGYPYPDLIKLDVQGAELDVLTGATEVLNNVTDVILELPNVEYNIGAPTAREVILFMVERGFELITILSDNGYDADHHFRKVK